MSRALWLLLTVVAVLVAAVRPPASPADQAADGEFPRVPATEPAQAESTFRTLHGFRMELLAAEPLVTDPVALEYDENGLAWVVEMRDYPYTDKSTDRPNVERTTDAPLGRVRILEDTDGDGRFDKSDIFAEDLSWPTGIALWKGGCYVTATPDVWYLKDTDGDRKADVRRKVFTGFKKLNVQGVINNPRWGLDHRLYCSGASNGGEITKPDDPGFKKVTFGAADFAFDPHAEAFEVLTGGARFGHSFDDWGNRFLCNIRNPVQHVLFENRYLARNPYLTVSDVVHDAAEAGDTLPVYRASPPEPWRAARALRYRTETHGMSRPRSELASEGYFTSACGITIYRGSAYPKEFDGNAFLGEVSGNLIHRQAIEPDGPTFKSRRADEGAEIVASTDNWFRPVNFTNAPDGTLHVCDMYRETIEHPWSIPDDMKAVLDLESGRDRGRLYRLAPPKFQRPTVRPQLGKATAAELVAALENPNSWWRDTAHRLIYERQDKACVESLRKMLRESKNPLARLHAMWSLDGLGALTDDDWMEVMFGRSNSAPLRTAALKLGEPRLGSEKIRNAWFGKFFNELPMRQNNPPVSEFQLALSGGVKNSPAHNQLFWLLTDKNVDKYTRTAALVSCADSAAGLLIHSRRGISDYGSSPPGFTYFSADVARQLGMMVGAKGIAADIREVLSLLTQKTADGAGTDSRYIRKFPPVLAGLAEGLRRNGKTVSQFATDDEMRAALKRQFADAAAAAVTENRPPEERLGDIQLLAQGEWRDVRPTLERLLDPREPAPLQTEAIRALGGFREAEVPSLLLKNYRSLSPSVRTEVVEALASRADRHAALLDAIEAKQVGVVDVPQARRLLIVRSKDPAIGPRAEKMFNAATGARRDVVERYKPALKLAADAARGQTVFLRECKACHKLRDQGFDVGPNLATVLHRTPDELLTHILDPNREVSPNYVEYVVELDDGRTVTGLVGDDTATGLTLRKAENVRETVLRRNIEAMYATGKSLMPEGLEQKLTTQEAADLVAFLLNRK